MKTVAIACAASVLALNPVKAEETSASEDRQQIELLLPTSTADCIKTLENVLQRALAADLLDDQIDEAGNRFESLEIACIDGRFGEALEEARSIERLVAMNK